MAITRQQSKKMSANAHAQAPAPETICSINTKSSKNEHGIDFVDASKEWRKNKIKCDNCTFEYI